MALRERKVMWSRNEQEIVFCLSASNTERKQNQPASNVGYLILRLNSLILASVTVMRGFLFSMSINYLILVCAACTGATLIEPTGLFRAWYDLIKYAPWWMLSSQASLSTNIFTVLAPVGIGPYSIFGSVTVILCTELHHVGSTHCSLRVHE